MDSLLKRTTQDWQAVSSLIQHRIEEGTPITPELITQIENVQQCMIALEKIIQQSQDLAL